MHWDEMSDEQKASAELFANKLSAAGWMAGEVLEMLRDGIAVDPEGLAFLDLGNVRLDAKYDAAQSSVILWLDADQPKQENRYKLEFAGKDRLETILNWLVKNQSQLRPDTFSKFLGEIIDDCTRVFLIREDGTLMLIQRATNR